MTPLQEIQDLSETDNFRIVHQSVEEIYTKIDDDLSPYIVVCGLLEKISAVYVVFSESWKYKVDTLVGALDIFFKTFVVLQKKFPKVCKNVFQFLEYFVYVINDRGMSSGVLILAKDIRLKIIKNLLNKNKLLFG